MILIRLDSFSETVLASFLGSMETRVGIVYGDRWKHCSAWWSIEQEICVGKFKLIKYIRLRIEIDKSRPIQSGYSVSNDSTYIHDTMNYFVDRRSIVRNLDSLFGVRIRITNANTINAKRALRAIASIEKERSNIFFSRWIRVDDDCLAKAAPRAGDWRGLSFIRGASRYAKKKKIKIIITLVDRLININQLIIINNNKP